MNDTLRQRSNFEFFPFIFQFFSTVNLDTMKKSEQNSCRLLTIQTRMEKELRWFQTTNLFLNFSIDCIASLNHSNHSTKLIRNDSRETLSRDWDGDCSGPVYSRAADSHPHLYLLHLLHEVSSNYFRVQLATERWDKWRWEVFLRKFAKVVKRLDQSWTDHTFLYRSDPSNQKLKFCSSANDFAVLIKIYQIID